jgi:TRAP-type C4-dicarboxylate transport system permease small subunit
MAVPALISPKARHLKWRALDLLEQTLMVLAGLLLLGFIVSVMADVGLRILSHPWLEAAEWTLGCFLWGSFLGGAVAVRRNEHFKLAGIATTLRGWPRTLLETFNRLVLIGVALCMAIFGYQLFVTGFTAYLQPSTIPLAIVYAAIPVSGALVALFGLEELINGLRYGFVSDNPDDIGSEYAVAPVSELILVSDSPRGGVSAGPIQSKEPAHRD